MADPTTNLGNEMIDVAALGLTAGMGIGILRATERMVDSMDRKPRRGRARCTTDKCRGSRR